MEETLGMRDTGKEDEFNRTFELVELTEDHSMESRKPLKNEYERPLRK